MSSDLKNVLSYVVAKRLANDEIALRALELYFVEKMRPADVAVKLGLSKNVVRGYAARVMERIQRKHLAPIYVAKALELARRIEPIIVFVKGMAFCKLCRRYVAIDVSKAYSHVVNRHRKLIEDIVEELVGGDGRG